MRARLDAFCIPIVIISPDIRIDHQVRRHQRAGFGAFVRFRNLISLLRGDFRKMRQAHGVFGDLVKIVRRRIVLGVVQAVRVHEVGAFAPQLLRLGVHHVDEFLNVSAAHIIRQHHGGVVSGRDHHAVQKLKRGQLLAVLDAGKRALRPGELIDHFFFHRNFCPIQVLDVF